MKIFGHYIFEDSPEKKNLLEKEQRESYLSCQDKIDDPYGVPFPSDKHDYMGGSEKDHMRWDLECHKEDVKKRICHYYHNKKYCYHTGTEIITDL